MLSYDGIHPITEICLDKLGQRETKFIIVETDQNAIARLNQHLKPVEKLVEMIVEVCMTSCNVCDSQLPWQDVDRKDSALERQRFSRDAEVASRATRRLNSISPESKGAVPAPKHKNPADFL